MSTNVYEGQVGGELLVDIDKKAICTSEIDKRSGHIMYTTKLFSCKKVIMFMQKGIQTLQNDGILCHPQNNLMKKRVRVALSQ